MVLCVWCQLQNVNLWHLTFLTAWKWYEDRGSLILHKVSTFHIPRMRPMILYRCFFVHPGHPIDGWLSMLRYMKSVRGQLQPSGNPTHAVGFVSKLGTMSHSFHGSISPFATSNDHFRDIWQVFSTHPFLDDFATNSGKTSGTCVGSWSKDWMYVMQLGISWHHQFYRFEKCESSEIWCHVFPWRIKELRPPRIPRQAGDLLGNPSRDRRNTTDNSVQLRQGESSIEISSGILSGSVSLQILREGPSEFHRCEWLISWIILWNQGLMASWSWIMIQYGKQIYHTPSCPTFCPND